MTLLIGTLVIVDQIAVILPGAGSSADFVARAFAEPLRAAGYALVAVAPVPGPGLVAGAVQALDAASARYGPRLRLVGGVSLGAHLAARWASSRAGAPAGSGAGSPAGSGAGSPVGSSIGFSVGFRAGSRASSPGGSRAGPWAGLDGLVLALPAWTGPPGPIAAATAASAATVDRLGTAGALAAAGRAIPWVAAELAAAWPSYGPELASSLRAAAAAPGPDLGELAGLDLPVGLVAFTDDPLHPCATAELWAATLPRAVLHRLALADAAPDRTVLGTAALAALAAARQVPARR
jgi:pimeloyl-ACP methyl ester carboxylesterase